MPPKSGLSDSFWAVSDMTRLLVQPHAELRAEAVDYVTGVNEAPQEPPAPVVAILVDAAVDQEIEAMKTAVLQVRQPNKQQ